ncbi:hypothetical protein B0H17DRAFT_938814 [Mycena rosella]|uniref:CxC6 like cysteine cluster associated with KDZ domain-containing protein n=1 Tax=Mycena rosella TaxID=1033263 RepID=A0AAD7GCJ2_MYCRO|nr:hypothetical protein B0H17DRAFT_938814 [Mycena rosella]
MEHLPCLHSGINPSSGAETLVPPVSFCLHPSCNSTHLSEKKVVEVRLYTLHRGILPVFSKSLYCRGCHTCYYHNYFVQEAHNTAAQREYYRPTSAGASPAMPKYIHVFESCFVEHALCVYFKSQLCISQSAFLGIACIYNSALAHTSEAPSAPRLKDELAGDLVLESFFLHSILRDKIHRNEPLALPHHGPQNHRFDEVLAECNYRMVGTGQEMWAHTCHRCTKIYQGEDRNWYRMSGGVHDGVSVRHVGCGVHNCTEAVQSQHNLFCYTHRDIIKICCIRGCSVMAQPGFRTCTEPSHRAFQTDSEERNTAMFQLHTRLRNGNISQVPMAGGTPLKGHLYCSWMHSEQLFARCCGVIISRATFFGSEGVSGVNTFLKATFPEEFPASLPSYIFYDNNCQFLKHLRHCDDHYFDNVGLPVNVFHFKCKHTDRDIFCELIGADGKWIFNSSAAEQANIWFGKFQNIVQEMPVIRYNFFLDEMIALHKREIFAELEAKGNLPHLLSEDFLRSFSLSSPL